jgi:hypothetical protein
MHANPSLNREHASKGWRCVKDTSTYSLNFYGFTIETTAVIAAYSAPTSPGPEMVGYTADSTGLVGMTLAPGYHPIRGSSLQLTSGTAILWLE